MQTNDDVLKKAWSGNSGGVGGDEAGNNENDTFILKERAKKTRKLTRGLREFTRVPSEGERKCEGW